MTKLAAILIYGKNSSKILFTGTAEPIAMKFDMSLLRLEYYNLCINLDFMMTLTDLTAGST